MAKVRVYELARELDMESKKLVDELIAGGIKIKNYMSTLDDQSAARAREIVSGAVAEVVEEKRIKPTVIRRRKRIVKVEKEGPEREKIEEKPDDEVSRKVEKEGPEREKIEEKPDDEVSRPEETLEEVKVPEVPRAEKVSVAEEVPKTEAPLKEEPPPPEGVSVVEPEEDAQKAPRPKKRAEAKPKKEKKRKVDQPAKIIKLPEEGPLRDRLAKEIQVEPVRPHVIPPVPKITPDLRPVREDAPQKEAPSKKKKGRKRKEMNEVGDEGLSRRRKKEVYERADLYGGRSKRLKGKKAGKKSKEAPRKLRQTEITVPKAIKRRIKVQDYVTVTELAKAMGTKAADLLKRFITSGAMVNINQSIDFETASVVADDLGFELELDSFDEELFFSDTEDRPEDLVTRPPVVTIMGHVDHGKTSLLDYIRKSNIIGGETGGITQHIGAYYVKTEGGDIVFLDTPGHEAFTAMRARGAKVTDIIVLVVAADDGIMPQTKEAVNHARAAGIPLVVAVNKIDKPDANQEKVKRELAELDLAPEEWGGDTLMGYISAKTGEGIDALLGLLLLQAEMLELKGNPAKEARGTIIEAELDKSKGPVATVLIKNGMLHNGDQFVCGDHYGRVRAMLDHRGRKMKSAGPSVPVKLYGISGVPMAGDEFIVVKDEKSAKQIIEHRKDKGKKRRTAKRGLVSLDDLFERIKEGEIKELNVVLKADVQGSVEALFESLVKQGTEEVKLNIIHSATGAITESDVMLASASGAIIIGFNVRANPRVSEIAEKEKINIRFYDVIYNAIKDIRLAMVGLLEPVLEEHVIGRAEIKEIFRVPKVGAIAGCQVTDGHVERNANARVLRDEVVVFDGKLASLRRFKEDVKEVQTGYECGIGLENFNDIKPGDVFEVYEVEEVAPEL